MTRLRTILGGLTLCVTCLHPHSLPAQPWLSPGQLATAGVGIGLPETTYGPNPASRGGSLVMAGVIREFSLAELTSSTLLLSRLWGSLGLRHMAFASYSESAVSLTGSGSVGRWRLGARLRETWVRPTGFRTRWDTDVTIGALLPIKKSHIGVALTGESLGLGWSVLRESWTVAVDLQTTQSGLSAGAGWHFDASDALTLQGSVSTNPSRLGLGTHLRIARWSVLIGLQRHLVLGWSSGLAITWG